MDPSPLPTILGIAMGLGLAAACGFRVFVPLLVAGLAGRFGHLPLSGSFTWVASTPALILLGSATLFEIAAYYIPWLDHALDVLATPAAVVAGVLASASVMVNLPQPLGWAIAIVGGGSVAGLIQGASVLFRLKSTALTGGAGNPVLATAELIGAIATAVLAILLPLAALAVVGLLLVAAFRATGRIFFGRRRAAEPSQ
jgi:hypothetical protein